MDELDLYLATAARRLVKHNASDLATRLLSCSIVEKPSHSSNGSSWVITVHIQGPRDMYELFLGAPLVKPTSYNKADRPNSVAEENADIWLAAAAFVEAYGWPIGTNMTGMVRFFARYGSAGRSTSSQSELYMYVFGEDPIGQQVQVLDVGPHSAPTRQLIVSPVPVLPVTDLVRDEKLSFVVMPFAPQFRPVYDAIFRAVTDSGMVCRRGDDISQPGAILSQIWQSMLQARLVIADISGGNGNVLYELGLAHVLGHEAILLAQHIDDVPFDLRHQRTILYSTEGDGLDSLRASLTAAVQSSLAVKR